MDKHIKGKDVNLLINGNVVAATSSCDFSLTANTTDAATKESGMWDDAEFTYYDWSASNESYIVDIAYLYTLLNTIINGDATVDVNFWNTGSFGNNICVAGKAIITSFKLDAAMGDYAKVSLSLDGAGALSPGSETTPTFGDVKNKIRGKALMLAIMDDDKIYHTIACSTSHSLTISVQTGDSRDKDNSDLAPQKEVTGYSMTVSTENLFASQGASPDVMVGCINNLKTSLMSGKVLNIALGYYPDSVPLEETSHDWGDPSSVVISANFLCTSIQVNGGDNKSDATFTAEFSAKGKPTITRPTAQVSE